MVKQMSDLERIKIIRNGEKVKPTFSREEMGRRNSKLRKYMGEKSIDAVLFTSYHNINYYSDFLYTAFGRNYGLVVTQDKHVTVSANIDAGMPWRRSYEDNVVYTDWRRDNYLHAVKTVLDDAGVKRGRLGIEFDHVNIDLRKQIEDAFPDFELVDVAQDLMKFRMIKSAEEIEHIKNGARVCDVGGYAVVEAIAAGVPEYEVALAGTQAMTREIAKLYPHAELRDSWIWFQSGINTDGAHNWATSRKIQKGDILSHNSFSMIAGYYTALERTMFFEEVDDKSLEYWNINVDVHKRGMELIKPGVKCKDICEELNEMFREHNLLPNRTFGYGHSFGVLSHYYGREGGLEFREDIETVLEPGMVISMEPMIMIPEGQPGAGGYREHDILVIKENGEVEDITGFPFGPEHNIIKK
ncbi:creatinase CreA (plasmid) [Peptoclostridium acidaminophilum DSM 3953]|uniref:Creatinase CreA n=1 Tax=Peptoclostridium acidaminophilum DSM 3953 TaxID=1286171 RepID=W8T9A3_PEPAC|nr:M24 family metallopeptidase [Peptoclostridium acidaminophilum]AHM58239.1 creatinase CreA [Peptoclostridium acidaminophilum DSM 3953]